MKKIIKEDEPLERFELEPEEAVKLMKEKGQPYKVELINDLPPTPISVSINRASSPTCAPAPIWIPPAGSRAMHQAHCL